MKMTPHGQMNRHYPPPFMTGGGGGSSSSGGGGGGHPSNRRRTERNKGPGEEMGSVGSKEKSISNTGSIDVIPEDQLQANCAPTDVNATAANSGSAVPSEEGSQYTKGGEQERCHDRNGPECRLTHALAFQKHLVQKILKILLAIREG